MLGGQALVYHPGVRFILMTMLTLTTGSAFIMWLGEQISERGIGNGMSLIIFAGIIVGLPHAVAGLWDKIRTEEWGALTPIIVLMLAGADARRRGVHRLRRGRAETHPGAVRQARDGAQGDGRADDLSAAARQFRRRDSADFRQFAAHRAGHVRSDFRQPLGRTFRNSAR